MLCSISACHFASTFLLIEETYVGLAKVSLSLVVYRWRGIELVMMMMEGWMVVGVGRQANHGGDLEPIPRSLSTSPAVLSQPPSSEPPCTRSAQLHRSTYGNKIRHYVLSYFEGLQDVPRTAHEAQDPSLATWVRALRAWNPSEVKEPLIAHRINFSSRLDITRRVNNNTVEMLSWLSHAQELCVTCRHWA